MKIMCNIVTGAIKDLAKKIGRSESYTCNLVSVWQTQNNAAEYPTAAQLDALLKSNKEQAWDIYLAVPHYEVREYTPNIVPIEHVNGQVYLMRLPKGNPMQHFYNMYKHLPELRDLVSTPEEAYRFILWREMAFMQYDLSKKVANRPIAEGEAIKKLKEWKKRQPQVKEAEQESTVHNYYTGFITPDANTVFVFGSNPEGRHGAGAAKVARESFGAVYGQGEGLQGNSYALPTKDLRVTANNGLRSISREQIIENIKKLYDVARSMPEKTFKVAYTNGATEVTLNGYSGQEMAEMFLSAGEIPSNVQFSENWKPMLEQGVKTTQPTQAKAPVATEYNLPNIGAEVLNVDPSNPVARLAKDFTAIERHDRVVMLARNFSNIVDRAVEEAISANAAATVEEMGKEHPNRGELARLYEKALILNDSTRGRRAVMQEITVQQIFKQMREEIESYLEMTAEELDEDYGEGRGEYMLNAYQKILDNWQALLDEACIIIEGTENVRVVTNKHNYHTGTNTTTVVGGTVADSSQDEDTNETEFSDDENGNRADGNGGWSFKVRFVDPRTSLSRGVKRVLSGIKKEGVDGEPEVDDLGNIRYLNSEYAHAALVNELSGMIDANDFSVKNEDGTFRFPALEKVAEKYSWVNQVISALQAEPNLISSFFADFRKDFIPYWMQYYDESEGKWKTKALNQAVALDSTKTAIINNYEQGTILDEDSIYEAGRKLNTAKASIGLHCKYWCRRRKGEYVSQGNISFIKRMQ